jgi:hypothetical protein
MYLDNEVDNVQTREDLARFLNLLLEDLMSPNSEWENPTLDSYLEALAAVVDGLDARFANLGMKLPDEPSWQLVADVLLAARTYE